VLKNKFNLLVIINAIFLLLIVGFILFKSFFISNEIVYVDNIKLFDGFNMTKEMKKFGEKEFNSRKKLIDSLYSLAQSENLPEKDKKNIVQEFIGKQEEFEQFNQRFAAEESGKIWKRINGYSQEFAKEKGYKIVIGSDNKRNVLFADESIDVTNDLINYINKKYEGLK
jgi:outer membrane protein